MKRSTAIKDPGGSADASAVEVTHIVQPSDANVLGNIFGGRIMEWIDMAGALVAFRYTRRICVTASMDDLHFISPVKVGNIVILKARVNYTGRTSLEVGVKVEAENPLTGERTHTASSYLTFVALDDNGRPTDVPPLQVETPEEIRRSKEAKARRAWRLTQREKGLFKDVEEGG